MIIIIIIITAVECSPGGSGPYKQTNKQTNKLRGVSPRTNYTDRATASCRLN
jgi:hypothetical protein